MSDELAFVYNWVPPYRRGLFELLAQRQRARFLLFGGRTLHPQDLSEQLAALDAPADALAQRQVYRAIRGGGFRAVVASTNGRLALPAAYLAARRERVPFILWATMWRHPRTLAHALSWLPMRRIYSAADAVVTYGPHVSRYVAGFRGDRNVFVAPQALDNVAFEAPPDAAALEAVRDTTGGAPFALFVGRLVEAKGVGVLAEAWNRLRSPVTGRQSPEEKPLLVVAGEGPMAGALADLPGVVMLGRVAHEGLPAWYAEASVVVCPSVPTRPFLEPWGYVVNEAFLQATPVIASDAVGAVVGGLLSDGAGGLVVRAGDARALAGALTRLLSDPQLGARMGVEARGRVASYTHAAQAGGFERALAACGVALDPAARKP